MIRFLTAGESHGPALTAIIEGFPAGLGLLDAEIQTDLDRRRQGYGRGGRMKIEGDSIAILSGVRHGRTLGSPISLQITNQDWERWQEAMAVQPVDLNDSTAEVSIAADQKLAKISSRVTKARPGHADLSGVLKYGHSDVRNVLERASARETAARVAIGAVARRLLAEFGIEVFSGVLRIGAVAITDSPSDWQLYRENVKNSPVAAPDLEISQLMTAEIDRAKQNGDSLGGVIEVIATGLPVGLGSHVHWDRRLDGRLSGALMSIPAIKAVAVGLGFEAAELPGSAVHDEIFYRPGTGYYRQTNNAGGIEGGITNGEPLQLRLAMKPIPTLYKPLQTVDLDTKQPVEASVERSDSCAVPAAAVVAEAMVCWILAEAMVEKFGGDSVPEMLQNYQLYQTGLKEK